MIGIPRGTRDFLPKEATRRKYVFGLIENIFVKHGFQKMETPAMENLDILLGKYGNDEKLIYKILNSGDITGQEVISEKGLRYDLTVPLARVVAMHGSSIPMPFKRYQIQQVWRADRPQKGRYREFTQCDIDIIGSDSLLNELELLQITSEVFSTLNIATEIYINNRKLLQGISEYLDCGDDFVKILTILDKLDKVGISGVRKELIDNNFSVELINKLIELTSLEGTNDNNILSLKLKLNDVPIALEGLNEIEELLGYLNKIGIDNVLFDVSLVRGLSYYTGCIFEVKQKEISVGSICGGGRYNNLTEIFNSSAKYSGVGITFGIDRIYDVMEQLNLFPDQLEVPCHMLFVNFGKQEIEHILPIVTTLRKKGMSIMIYPDNIPVKKQFAYANKLGIPYVAIIGEKEIEDETVTIKMMQSGNQYTVTLKEFFDTN